MRPESEIRRRRDELVEFLATPGEIDDGNEGLFLMKTHIVLLTWVLGETDAAESAFNEVSDGLKTWHQR